MAQQDGGDFGYRSDRISTTYYVPSSRLNPDQAQAVTLLKAYNSIS